MNIRCRYDIDTASIRCYDILSKSYRRHVSTAITVFAYNSPLCLGSNDFKFIFDSVIAVVAVTSYLI